MICNHQVTSSSLVAGSREYPGTSPWGPPSVPWHTLCEGYAAMNSIFYIIGVVVVIVIVLKLLGLF